MIAWNRINVCSTAPQNISGEMLATSLAMLIFNLQRVLVFRWQTLSSRLPHNQKSHGFKSGDLGGRTFWNARLMFRVFSKCVNEVTEWPHKQCELELHLASKQLSPKHLSTVEQGSHVGEADHSNVCRSRWISLVLGIRVPQKKMDQLGNVPWSHTKQWCEYYAGELHERSLAVTILKCENCVSTAPVSEKCASSLHKMFQGHMSTSPLARNVRAKYAYSVVYANVCVTWQKLVSNVNFVRIPFHIVGSTFRTVDHDMFSSRDTARALLEDRTLRPAF